MVSSFGGSPMRIAAMDEQVARLAPGYASCKFFFGLDLSKYWEHGSYERGTPCSACKVFDIKGLWAKSSKIRTYPWGFEAG
jgi:hypothetical protein